MFAKLPSLLAFQPKFYSGGATRFYLPLLYDLIAEREPKSIVIVGFGDGQACFTFCQAIAELNLESKCVAVRRDHGGDDSAWLVGKNYGEEFYGARIRFSDVSSAEAAQEFADRTIDLIFLDDSDSGDEIRRDLAAWESKLALNGLFILHGTALERADDPKTAWKNWTASRSAVDFPDGIGLGIALPPRASAPPGSLLAQLLAGGEGLDDLLALYRLAVARMEAQARTDEAIHKQAALETRQVWLDSLLADRWKVQEIMDHQERALADWKERCETQQRDRAKTQLFIDRQHEELVRWVAETKKAKAERAQLKAQLKERRQKPKERRSLAAKVVRELRRVPRNLGIVRAPATTTPPKKKAAVIAEASPADRYADWISEHEAARGEEALPRTEQAVKISLLVPVYNTAGTFLDEMFASVSAQTYGNWELCVVDAGSDRAETLATLQKWIAREPTKIRALRLEKNLGIAENTNRALELATGEFIACLDHDDLLAPFALDEVARAIEKFPQADIFYSAEDRWSEQGERHAPFFKPEWSPALLLNSMYLGHLTVYRRSLVDRVGRFRKEFDLSQDYDFALRATEQARAIHHIPHVLYHWREHPASGSVGGKPDARKTNLAALEDAMRRRNLPAEIIEYPTANRARLKVDPWPRVSVIVPTDSATRAQTCLRDLSRKTSYPDLEIVLVTNSKLLASLQGVKQENATVRLVAYDKPFNFSDKCNAGANVASGARLIFFNDDVEPAQADWIQNLIEPLEDAGVGAVSPKLLYETGKIQHAGLVMGVRGLAGTAFHQRAADSTEHVNLAQSLREVAALSAACLALRREDFLRLGGFDAVHTPIAHSDIDLCFKVRAAGLRCVYTPYATLSHAGHASIGAEEKKEVVRLRDKASIYLLKRWPHYTTHDPYFTENMRDWLYSDSPTPIRMAARDGAGSIEAAPDLLFISHDLSLSGAPMMLLHAAHWCQANGIFVVMMAPKDGPLRAELEAAGIPLIIDPLIETGHPSFADFARDFDCLVVNTILSGAAVRAMKGEKVPIVWWLHEPESVGEHFISLDEKVRMALPLADVLVAPSEWTAAVYRPFNDRPTRCLRNAVPDPGISRTKNETGNRPLRILHLGSIEPRKGQDIFVIALALLPRELQEAAQFQIAGRILDPFFWSMVETIGTIVKNLSVTGAVSHAEAIALMRQADVVVSASRDEAMPTITILEAMSLGKAIVATTVGGAHEVLLDGENSLLVRAGEPKELAAVLGRLIENPALVAELGERARTTYEQGFTMERFGAEFRALIDDVIANPASKPDARSK